MISRFHHNAVTSNGTSKANNKGRNMYINTVAIECVNFLSYNCVQFLGCNIHYVTTARYTYVLYNDPYSTLAEKLHAVGMVSYMMAFYTYD